MKAKLYILSLGALLSSCLSNLKQDNKEIASSYLEKVTTEVKNHEVEEIIFEITNQFELQNLPAINSYFDYEALLSRGITKSNKNLSKVGDVTKGANKIGNNNPMLDKIQESFTYYDFIKQYIDSEGFTIIVFRGYGAGGINYHEFVLGSIEGETKIIDIYLVLNGSYLSVTLLDFMSDLIELETDKQIAADYTENMKASSKYSSEGDYESAYNEFQKIPSEARNSSQLLAFLEIQMLLNYDEDLYLKKIEEYRYKYPESSSSVDLFSLDYYFLKERYEDVLVSLRNLKENYPNDNVIDFLIGSTYSYMGDCKKAVKNCELSVASNKEMVEFQDGLMAIYFECEMHEEGFKLASQLIKEGYMSFEDVSYFLSTLYEDFESWSSYKDWSNLEKH